jgi:PAS domain S-box-containing protein
MDSARPKEAGGNLLVADDDLLFRQTLEALLTGEGYDVRCAPNGQTALMFAGEEPPELILLDIRLPDMDGFEACRRLREDPRTSRIPVIFISGLDEVTDKVKGFAAGGVDYITKPFKDEELLARVETHLNLRRLQEQIDVQNVHLQQEIARSKRAEETIKISETRYRRLFETARDGVLILDADTGGITDVNPFLVEMLGYGREDFLEKKLWEIGALRDIENSKAAFSELQTKGYVRYESLPLQTKDGRLIDVEFVSNVYIVNHHKVIQCNIRDISERKRAQEALRKAHDELDERVKERTADLASAKEQLQARLREIEGLKQRLEKENIFLRQEIKLQYVHEEIVGRSEKMKKVLSQAEQVAPTDSTVLIQGETGTGKELLARAIHHLSSRKDRPLVTVNCASLPPTLIESELFGREQGAYTGALTRMAGRFEAADGATLFLDEIGELPHDVQSKLLRVLEEGRFERLGSSKTLQVNVRIIAATNRDLPQDVNEGRFRKDLYYRLNVFPIAIPPLRERAEDIPLLVWAFVRQFEKKMGKRVDTISRKSLEALQRHAWPGNVRELRNVIEHAMIASSGRTLTVTQPKRELPGVPETRTLQDLERSHILGVLEKTGWRITGKGGASEILGIKRTTLQSKMKKLGIKRPAT